MSAFDAAQFTRETGIQLEQYPMDSCPRNRRGGKVEHPFEGCSIWLTLQTPMKLVSAGMDLQAMQRNNEAGRQGFRKLGEGLAACVVGHDLPGYPQLWENASAVEELPAEVVFHIYQIVVTGEPPAAEGNASQPGADGDGIQASTAPRMTIQS